MLQLTPLYWDTPGTRSDVDIPIKQNPKVAISEVVGVPKQ